jgi:hypothetical protein
VLIVGSSAKHRVETADGYMIRGAGGVINKGRPLPLRTKLARFRVHLLPITAYPWISILASGAASPVMVIRALPGKLSPKTSLRICVTRSP